MQTATNSAKMSTFEKMMASGKSCREIISDAIVTARIDRRADALKKKQKKQAKELKKAERQVEKAKALLEKKEAKTAKKHKVPVIRTTGVVIDQSSRGDLFLIAAGQNNTLLERNSIFTSTIAEVVDKSIKMIDSKNLTADQAEAVVAGFSTRVDPVIEDFIGNGTAVSATFSEDAKQFIADRFPEFDRDSFTVNELKALSEKIAAAEEPHVMLSRVMRFATREFYTMAAADGLIRTTPTTGGAVLNIITLPDYHMKEILSKSEAKKVKKDGESSIDPEIKKDALGKLLFFVMGGSIGSFAAFGIDSVIVKEGEEAAVIEKISNVLLKKFEVIIDEEIEKVTDQKSNGEVPPPAGGPALAAAAAAAAPRGNTKARTPGKP